MNGDKLRSESFEIVESALGAYHYITLGTEKRVIHRFYRKTRTLI